MHTALWHMVLTSSVFVCTVVHGIYSITLATGCYLRWRLRLSSTGTFSALCLSLQHTEFCTALLAILVGTNVAMVPPLKLIG